MRAKVERAARGNLLARDEVHDRVLSRRSARDALLIFRISDFNYVADFRNNLIVEAAS